MKTIIYTLLLLAALSIPAHYAYADFGELEVPIGELDTSIDKIADSGLLPYVDVILRYITVAIIIIGVILIVSGGFVYMTAGGDSSRVGTAKTLVTAALLGIALALMAYLILNTISTQFTSGLKEPKDLLKIDKKK